MLLSDAIDHYKADRKAKGYAKATIANEQSVLKHLLADVGNIQVSSLTARHMDGFWHKHSDWKPGTFNRAKSYLSSFFKWCQVRGYMSRTFDPLEGMRNQKVMPRDQVIIPQGQFEDLLAGTSNPRYRAMIALGLYLFVRVSEMREMKWSDVDFEKKTVLVHRVKTGQVDTLPMCEELEVELKRWRLAYGEQVGQVPRPGWYVIPGMIPPRFSGKAGGGRFVLQRGPQLVPTKRLGNFTRCVKLALADAGFDGDGEGGHTLRRSGATALYNELCDRGHDKAMRTVQAMLGHASIKTTEIYLRIDVEQKARNDLLAGRKMFSGSKANGSVVNLKGQERGQEDAGAL